MRRRTKILIGLAVIIVIPFLIVAANNLASLFYTRSCKSLDQGASSANYELKRVPLPGFIQSKNGNTNVVDSSSISIGTASQLPVSYVTYEGNVYLDTVQDVFKVETKSGGPQNEKYRGQSHYITFNKKGKILSDTQTKKDSADLAKNGLLLKDQILPFQPWLNQSKPIYIAHFSKDEFNSHCFNPLRGWGSPTGGSVCYFWSGRGFYNLVYNKEVLKFQAAVSSGAVLFSQDDDFSGAYLIKYSEVPERFRSRVEGAFLISEDKLYMVSRK
ncbi:hypothetical protein HDF26_004443 [Pedobacter cryoconitis]|uniref:hypothetical protein n=1 Tax=Pedobacter cryoconitis TaxID=188932 RepID=UPI001621C45C|nr:hypothetical protein [Pedobacter cryoconitis]MBB6273970.1 hypothetical protein [Pedobacter cryoconitis]